MIHLFEEQAVLDFDGTGDIEVGHGKLDSGKYVVTFSQGVPREIGARIEDTNDPKLLMVFNKLESIDIVIKHLNIIREIISVPCESQETII